MARKNQQAAAATVEDTADETGLSAEEIKLLSEEGMDMSDFGLDEDGNETGDGEDDLDEDFAVGEDDGEGDDQSDDGETNASAAAAIEADKNKKPDPANDPQRPDGYVPYQALRDSRNELKQMQEQNQQLRGLIEQINERLFAKPEPEPEEPKDFLTDPEGAYGQAMKTIETLSQRLANLEQGEQQKVQQTQQQKQIHDFRMDVAREYEEQAAGDPEINDAWDFMDMAITREYQSAYADSGINLTDYKQRITNSQAQYARKNGIPVGQHVKNLARARGWSEGMMANFRAEQNGEVRRNPQLEQKAQRLAQAQRTNKSLGGSGTGGDPEVTLETLGKMSGPQLERFVAMNPKLVEKLTGIK